MKKIITHLAKKALILLIALITLVASAYLCNLLKTYTCNQTNDVDYCCQGCVSYQQLSYKQKIIYRQLYEYAQDFNTAISLSDVDGEDALIVAEAFTDDHPEFFWFSGYQIIYCGSEAEITMTIDEEDKELLEEQYNQCIQAADEIIASFDYQNDFEAILQAHDYIIQNTEYVSDSQYNQDIRSVFLNHETVCAGYAKAFEFLCHRMGCTCGYAKGRSKFSDGSEDGDHGWNYVEIDDEYYWVDVTWDDHNRLNGEEGRYNFFLVSDDILKISHEFEDNVYPCCNSYAYSDFTGNNPPLSEYNEEKLKQIVLKSIQEKTKFVVQFINKEDYDLAKKYLIDDSCNLDVFKQLYYSVYGENARNLLYMIDENENRIEIEVITLY